MTGKFYSCVSALTLLEAVFAPHHWAVNYMAGFCDTFAIYGKALIGCGEQMRPIVAYFPMSFDMGKRSCSFDTVIHRQGA